MMPRCVRAVLPLLLLITATPSPSAPIEPKRRNPDVLGPVEFQAQTARVCVHSYIIATAPGKRLIGILNRDINPPEVKFVKESELKLGPMDEFARDLYPLRVAVVTGSFPCRKQVEAFREALRLRSLDDLREEPGAFPSCTGLNVERRETGPKKTDWKALDLQGKDRPYRAVLDLTRNEFEPEPAAWKPVQVSGFTMPLPVLNQSHYPDCTLPLLAKTLADPKARALPDYCLLRFLDVTVEPGKTYEYRVQVRLANPNYGKKTRVEKESFAEPKELLGPWTRVPGTVAFDPELTCYAVDAKALDPKFPGAALKAGEIAFEVHRWIGHYELAKGRDIDYFPVGRWVIAERIVTRPGELVAVRHKVKLPIWAPEQKGYVVAGRRGAGGVEVDFGGSPRKPNEGPLLIDFEGPRRVHGRVATDGPVEVLLLAPEGKLLARNSEADAADPVRIRQLGQWKKWLAEEK